MVKEKFMSMTKVLEEAFSMPKSIRLYRWGNLIKCDINGTTYFTPEAYLKGLAFKTRFFVYLTRWHTEEEHKLWLEKKAEKERLEEQEFKKKVKISLKSKDNGVKHLKVFNKPFKQ